MISIVVPLSGLLVVLILGVIALIRAPSADIVEILRTILGRTDDWKPRRPDDQK
jgi:hypothetical protein